MFLYSKLAILYNRWIFRNENWAAIMMSLLNYKAVIWNEIEINVLNLSRNIKFHTVFGQHPRKACQRIQLSNNFECFVSKSDAFQKTMISETQKTLLWIKSLNIYFMEMSDNHIRLYVKTWTCIKLHVILHLFVININECVLKNMFLIISNPVTYKCAYATNRKHCKDFANKRPSLCSFIKLGQAV